VSLDAKIAGVSEFVVKEMCDVVGVSLLLDLERKWGDQVLVRVGFFTLAGSGRIRLELGRDRV